MAAPNTVSTLMYKILARFHVHLRGTLLLPRLVNSDFSEEAKQKGNTIDVKVPAKMSAYDIAPSVVRSEQDGQEILSVPIPLNNWKGAGFFLTDKEMAEIDAQKDFLPMQSIEAIDAVVSEVNRSILATYVKAYGIVGTPGQTPFQRAVETSATVHHDTNAITQARRQLNIQRAPQRNRRFVMDPDAAGNALSLRAFQSAEQMGSDKVKVEGEIGRAFGFDIFEELEVPTHEAGTLTANVTVQGANAVGSKSVVLATDATGALALKVGDIIQVAGDEQTYVVGAALNVGNSASGAVAIEPGLRVATEGGEAVTLTPTHVANLAFHRDAIAFAQRPLQDLSLPGGGAGAMITTLRDPLTGLVLRLEVKRENKQWFWETDMLWGVEMVVRDLATRVAG